MKNLIAFIIIGLLILSFPANAQPKVVEDANGNYKAVKSTTAPAPEPATKTKKTFTDTKGIVYPVMVSKNGKEFYERVSKKGNKYRVYIKVN